VHYFGFLPMEVRPDIGTTLAAHLADEQRFDIGQPDLIGPRVGAEGPMGARSSGVTVSHPNLNMYRPGSVTRPTCDQVTLLTANQLPFAFSP
jgi:hypothetical protein